MKTEKTGYDYPSEIAHALDDINPRFFRNQLDGSAYAEYGCQCFFGWEALILSLAQDVVSFCDTRNMAIPKIIQIKQKIGRLVVYMETRNQGILSILADYSGKSILICDVCSQSIAINIADHRISHFNRSAI